MELTQFELWLKACEEFNEIVWCLEGSGDTGLYKLQRQYEYKNNFYYTDPTYIIWMYDRIVYVGRNAAEAYQWWQTA
jgi:hypothetical protein